MASSREINMDNIEIPDTNKILGREGSNVFEGTFRCSSPVAVKKVSLEAINDRSSVPLMKDLHHINVVRYHAFMDFPDLGFRLYALELCSTSLDKFYEDKDYSLKLSIEDMFIELAEGLAYIHDKVKLSHRNLKPHSALIWVGSGQSENQVVMKWADFGLRSKRMNERDEWRLCWLAPELLTNNENDEGRTHEDARKSDVFSAGLTFLYALLQGKHPYGANAEIVENLKRNEPVNTKNLELSDIGQMQLLTYVQEEMLKTDPKKRPTAGYVVQKFQDQRNGLTTEIYYDRTKQLGKGTFAYVFKGTWIRGLLRLKVAVKRVQLLNVDANNREEEALRKMNHPNVIKLHHAESDLDFRYYALELCRASLDELFSKKYEGPKPTTEDIILHLAQGLDCIHHDNNLVHRDLKPRNALIWVGPSSVDGKEHVLVKWADFGLSKEVNGRGTFTLSGIKGTQKWLAPEALKALKLVKDYDEEDYVEKWKELRQRGTTKSDVFAEGLTFAYILLDGKHLYGDDTDVVTNLRKNNPVNLTEISSSTIFGQQGSLYPLIIDMLKTDPLDRLTAKEVLIRLQDLHSNINFSIPKTPPAPNNLQCLSKSDTAITITWDHVYKNMDPVRMSYNVDYWPADSLQELSSTMRRRSTMEKKITLEPLDPDTAYCIQVTATYKDNTGSNCDSPACEMSATTEMKQRLALVILRNCEKCQNPAGSNVGFDVYKLPLEQKSASQIVSHYVFGKSSPSALTGIRKLRTILMVGASSSGKSTFINAMTNYIMGVEWNDNFRFRLIDKSDTKKSKTQNPMVTKYDLYREEGFRLDYSLTIINVPGLGGISGQTKKDNQIMEQIEEYLKSPDGIQQLDALCFVVQSFQFGLTDEQKFIFDWILSIFGQDNFKDNIQLIVTSIDNVDDKPLVIRAVKETGIPIPMDFTTGLPIHYKFNSSSFFTANNHVNREFNKMYYDLAVGEFERFFDDLSRMNPKPLSMTRKVREKNYDQVETRFEDLSI